MKKLTVYESLDYISIGEGENHLNRKQVNLLERYIKRENLKTAYIHWENNKFKFINYVGLITLDGFSIEILPKTKSLSTEINRKAMINMLVSSGFIDVKYSELHGLNLEKESLLEVLAYLYSKKLKKEILRGVFKEYVVQQDNLKAPKGKFIIKEQLKNIAKRNLKAASEYEEFTENNNLNGMFKLLTLRLTKIIRNLKTLDNLKIIYTSFIDVDEIEITENALKKIKFDRGNKRFYESFVLMNKLSLNKSSLGKKGREDGFALLFEVQELYERYIGLFIKKEFDSEAELQDTSKRLMVKESNNRNVIQLKPDIVLKEQGIIIDTKWKTLKKQNRYGVQVSDLYQMYAYLNRFENVNRVILMYPLTNEEIFNGETLEKYTLEEDRNQSIEIVAIDISGKEKTKEGLERLLSFEGKS